MKVGWLLFYEPHQLSNTTRTSAGIQLEGIGNQGAEKNLNLSETAIGAPEPTMRAIRGSVLGPVMTSIKMKPLLKVSPNKIVPSTRTTKTASSNTYSKQSIIIYYD